MKKLIPLLVLFLFLCAVLHAGLAAGIAEMYYGDDGTSPLTTTERPNLYIMEQTGYEYEALIIHHPDGTWEFGEGFKAALIPLIKQWHEANGLYHVSEGTANWPEMFGGAEYKYLYHTIDNSERKDEK